MLCLLCTIQLVYIYIYIDIICNVIFIRWGEVHKAAADNNRVVSSGWSKSVGVGGWSLGGGHGPFASNFGNGADNILEADIVTANGTLLTGIVVAALLSKLQFRGSMHVTRVCPREFS